MKMKENIEEPQGTVTHEKMCFKPSFVGLFHLYLHCLLYSLQTQYLILKLNFSVSIVSRFSGLVFVSVFITCLVLATLMSPLACERQTFSSLIAAEGRFARTNETSVSGDERGETSAVRRLCLHKLTGHRLDTSWFSWSVKSFVKVAYRTRDAIVISLLLLWFTSMLFQEIKLQLLHFVYFQVKTRHF